MLRYATLIGMEQTDILHMRIKPEIVRQLDELRKAEADLPSRSEMVRRLIVRAGCVAPPQRKGKKVVRVDARNGEVMSMTGTQPSYHPDQTAR